MWPHSIATGELLPQRHTSGSWFASSSRSSSPPSRWARRCSWQRGRWSITGDPYLQLGLANRPHGNRAGAVASVVLAVQPLPRWAIDLYTGWNSDLAIWTDGYYVPGAAGVRVRATSHLDVGATFGFPSILGPQNDVKSRVLFFDVGWR